MIGWLMMAAYVGLIVASPAALLLALRFRVRSVGPECPACGYASGDLDTCPECGCRRSLAGSYVTRDGPLWCYAAAVGWFLVIFALLVSIPFWAWSARVGWSEVALVLTGAYLPVGVLAWWLAPAAARRTLGRVRRWATLAGVLVSAALFLRWYAGGVRTSDMFVSFALVAIWTKALVETLGTPWVLVAGKQQRDPQARLAR